MPNVLFIGGPGNISGSAIEAALESGARVSVFTLPEQENLVRPEEVKYIRGDRNSESDLKAALTEAKPDVVVDFVLFTPEQAESSIRIFGRSVSQYIYVSTCDTYGYPLARLPMGEDDGRGEVRSQYAAKKLTAEVLFQEAAASAAFGLTIVRPSYSLGPTFAISAFSRMGGRDIVYRIRNRMPILVPGDGTTLLHASVATNTGRMIVRSVGSDSAVGSSYTCCHDHAVTHDEYVQIFGKIVGIEPEIVHVPSDLLVEWGSEANTHALLTELTRYNIQFATERFRAHYPDFRWTVTLEEGISSFIRYQDENKLIPDQPGFAFEDRAIDRWRNSISSVKGVA